ncbi:HEAT repeat domain-containing protein [bacterium]|nr:HEAT repeat domain-containing protein [bacterium]MCI0606733.1 HEAT repeat domain-containing protein [bacterium]
MDHKEYREQLPLLIYGDLGREEQKQLKLHLDQCELCTEELAQLEKLQSTVDAAAVPKPSAQLLNEARLELRAALRMERSRKTWKDIWTGRLQGWLPIFRLSFATMASLAFGIIIGYKAIQPKQSPPTSGPIVKTQQPSILPGETQITNVKFQDADASDGNVEFTFEAVKPMTYKGSINDARIQEVLTYALVNEQNPGIRLHAVNALNAKQLRKPDAAIKGALIQAMVKDENPGVRIEALTALEKFEPDEEIKQAFLHVLANDKNAAMRIAAIKSIETERLVDQEVVKVLREAQTDEEDYVRLKAKWLIQEVSQKQ